MITIEWYWVVVLMVITELLTLFGIGVTSSGIREDLEMEILLLRKELEDLESKHRKAMDSLIDRSSIEDAQKIVVGDYSLAVDPVNNCNLWMIKNNGEGMSFSPELLEKFFNENI